MYKTLLKLKVFALLGISLTLAGPLNATAGGYPNATPYVPLLDQIVLEPGWKSSCNSNFVIENLGDEPADVRIILGKDGVVQDTIRQWSKRGYNLTYHLSFAKQLGKTVNIDDVAMIENLSEDSRVSIHC